MKCDEKEKPYCLLSLKLQSSSVLKGTVYQAQLKISQLETSLVQVFGLPMFWEIKSFFTLRCTRAVGGGGGDFSKTISRQHLPFSVAVRISLQHILIQVWSEVVAMVSRYDVLLAGVQAILDKKLMHVFYLFQVKKYILPKAAKCLIISHFTCLA